ncbi:MULTISPECIES: hypothetical protein [unclassified Bradyrhizobium]|nr:MULTISPECIES: hypothetical protein [unclassified Bradyrhizobium]
MISETARTAVLGYAKRRGRNAVIEHGIVQPLDKAGMALAS